MTIIANALCAAGLGFFMMVGGAIAHYGWRDDIGNLPVGAMWPFVLAVICLISATMIGARKAAAREGK